ncbi:MAG: FAD-dependent oxidoreductase [Acidobacteria bacterium]|nr:FAD-dependent oxidoreductase [Acidobacteriota bacterium]
MISAAQDMSDYDLVVIGGGSAGLVVAGGAAQDMSDYDLVVIGGGSAGLVVAGGAAQLGARVALVEKKALGGDCLYTGCVPSKTFIRSARFAADVNRARAFGFAPTSIEFDGGHFAAITDRVARVIETVGEHGRPERFESWGVQVIFASPRFLSPHELEVTYNDSSRKRISAKRFCISTGSRPSIPPIKGLEEVGVITNEQVFNLKRLPQELIVLGGGPVGLELGQSFARFGSRVTVVEMGKRLLSKEDEEVSATMAEVVRSDGIEILLKQKAVSATLTNGRKVLTIEKGDGKRQVTADEILVATGRRPNIEGLNLEAAGVK